MEKKRLYFDMDGVLVDFMSGVNKVSDEVRQQYAGRLDEIPGVFALMEPMPGAIRCCAQAGRALRCIYTLYRSVEQSVGMGR